MGVKRRGSRRGARHCLCLRPSSSCACNEMDAGPDSKRREDAEAWNEPRMLLRLIANAWNKEGHRVGHKPWACARTQSVTYLPTRFATSWMRRRGWASETSWARRQGLRDVRQRMDLGSVDGGRLRKRLPLAQAGVLLVNAPRQYL